MSHDPNGREFCLSRADFSNKKGAWCSDARCYVSGGTSIAALAFPEPLECTSPAKELHTVHGAQDRPLLLVVHTYSENASFASIAHRRTAAL
jgi:hypothetical protein